MLEEYFSPFRKNVIGMDRTFNTPYGEKKIIYADWTASGRLYGPIEKRLCEEIMPFTGNTHTETTVTGSTMTIAYKQALNIIKRHVGASKSDVIIATNSGMTGVINKFQRILGLKLHEKFRPLVTINEVDKPVVFVSHMEHHSNQTSWLETIADVEIISANEEGLVDLGSLESLLKKYKNRKTKIAAVTSCSNVTGISTQYHDIAATMHRHGGLCFVDFAASAPYIDINMRPDNEDGHLDAIYFSPHKFLGGPGTPGVLIFDQKLYTNRIPDDPGGGTVDWTNPWGQHKYIEDIEAREDGGTPAFLQTIKFGMCVKLKDEMGVENILARENEILDILWNGLDQIPGLHVLANENRNRLGIISFYIGGLHYNLAVKILNDRYGIQVRGGCSCAGTYGHYLLNVSPETSEEITCSIDMGDMSAKPGWVRLSIHPVMSDEDIHYIVNAITELVENFREWEKDYDYSPDKNEFYHNSIKDRTNELVESWFRKSLK